MNTCLKVLTTFASYNILQYMCDFIHDLIFVTVSKCPKSPKLTNIVIIATFMPTALPLNLGSCEEPEFPHV
jgi:hypothetical protein